MRTIVAFVLTATLYAQPNPPSGANAQIALLEKNIADGRAPVQGRITLMNLYMNARNVEKRREQVLWLAEHNPEIPNFRNLPFNLGSDGPLPDAVGLEQEAAIWRTVAEKHDARPAALANAAWFFRSSDRQFAWSIVKQAETTYPSDPEIAKVRGALNAADVLGTDAAEATKARQEIEASNDAPLLVAAADALTQPPFNFLNTIGPTFEERFDIAEKWLLRAREIQPENREMKPVLGRVYQTQAGQSADPRWKVELFHKADALIENWFGLPQLAMAEYDAGDDEAAMKTVQRLLERKPVQPNFINMAHTVTGLVALDHKRIDDAKAELLASARITGNLEPNRTLAQALVDAGERDAVLQYLDMCRTFWKNDQGAIDYYKKMVRSPGTHDITTRYFPGLGVRGRPVPKLPIDGYEGKPLLLFVGRTICKDCPAAVDVEVHAGPTPLQRITQIAQDRGVVFGIINPADPGSKEIARQLEIDTDPTVVLVDASGRVVDFIPGQLNEATLTARIDQLSRNGASQKLPAPVPVGAFAWKPVAGAESYVVQWDQRDERGWLSDRDQHLVRVIPTHETSVTLDPTLGETSASSIRWRVFAVSRAGAGKVSEWNEIATKTP